jgi:hypothetical protein
MNSSKGKSNKSSSSPRVSKASLLAKKEYLKDLNDGMGTYELAKKHGGSDSLHLQIRCDMIDEWQSREMINFDGGNSSRYPGFDLPDFDHKSLPKVELAEGEIPF